MQRIAQAVQSCRETLEHAILQHIYGKGGPVRRLAISHDGGFTAPLAIQHKGLENTTVADVLMTKGDDKVGSWLWCRTNDTVYDAVKNMAENNVGSLVVLKPGEPKLIAGIITERDTVQNKGRMHIAIDNSGWSDASDYLKKIAAQGRSSKYTRVGEIMTHENKLITVPSDANLLHAMQLMTENHIRHVPVVDGKIVGMISIVDVVRAIVDQQKQEMKRLNEFIKGDYY
ncbi:CBS domain [Dillenia turbinata]|uniref:CBS domain n=1 Tax=Dillenia turbinata TaxID=194707 RepID=A0AAN8VRD7_9MAGN